MAHGIVIASNVGCDFSHHSAITQSQNKRVFLGVHVTESAVLVGHNSRVPAGWLVECVGQVVFASSKSRFPRSRRSATIAASVPRPKFSRPHQPGEYRNPRNPRKNTASQGFHD